MEQDHKRVVNEKRKVLIRIKGIQGEIGADEEIEMTTTGTMYDKNGVRYICYSDTVLDESIETKTTIKVTESKVTVIRYGGASTTMLFEKGKEHIVAYDTKFGVFQINTNTKSIQITEDEKTYHLLIEYMLEVNFQGVGLSKFELRIDYL